MARTRVLSTSLITMPPNIRQSIISTRFRTFSYFHLSHQNKDESSPEISMLPYWFNLQQLAGINHDANRWRSLSEGMIRHSIVHLHVFLDGLGIHIYKIHNI